MPSQPPRQAESRSDCELSGAAGHWRIEFIHSVRAKYEATLSKVVGSRCAKPQGRQESSSMSSRIRGLRAPMAEVAGQGWDRRSASPDAFLDYLVGRGL